MPDFAASSTACFASLLAIAETALASDSNPTADYVPHLAVVVVSSRDESVQLPVMIVVATVGCSFSKPLHLIFAPAVGLLGILVRAMDRLLLLLTQLSVRGLELPFFGGSCGFSGDGFQFGGTSDDMLVPVFLRLLSVFGFGLPVSTCWSQCFPFPSEFSVSCFPVICLVTVFFPHQCSICCNHGSHFVCQFPCLLSQFSLSCCQFRAFPFHFVSFGANSYLLVAVFCLRSQVNRAPPF